MVVTTINAVEGRKVVEYKDIVFGEVITGINFFEDIGAGPVSYTHLSGNRHAVYGSLQRADPFLCQQYQYDGRRNPYGRV